MAEDVVNIDVDVSSGVEAVDSGACVVGASVTSGRFLGASTGGTPALGTASHARSPANITATIVSPVVSVVVTVVGVVTVE